MTSDFSARRCLRHPDREAAARCTSCRRPFCRECVAEHGGRMVCAECLAGLAVATPAASPRRLRTVLARGCALGLGFLAAWGTFFVCGQLLHSLPAAVHDFAPILEQDRSDHSDASP